MYSTPVQPYMEEIIKHSHNFKNLIGQQFGRLTVRRYAGVNKHGQSTWKCECVCGKYTVLSNAHLKTGNSRSCGCLHHEELVRAKVHGHARRGQVSQEYLAYYNARQRCGGNPNHPDWKHYGGRGIKFLFSSFEGFLAHIGPKPSPSHELDRINVNGNYVSGNVRWVTQAESQRNKRNTKLDEQRVSEIRRRYFTGETTQARLAADYGVAPSTVSHIVLGKIWANLPPKKPSTSVGQPNAAKVAA